MNVSSEEKFPIALDRHPQNFLIRADHLVAHGDHGLQLRFGCGDRCHDINDVRLACGHRERLLLGDASALPSLAHRVLHERAEIHLVRARGFAAALHRLRGLLVGARR